MPEWQGAESLQESQTGVFRCAAHRMQHLTAFSMNPQALLLRKAELWAIVGCEHAAAEKQALQYIVRAFAAAAGASCSQCEQQGSPVAACNDSGCMQLGTLTRSRIGSATRCMRMKSRTYMEIASSILSLESPEACEHSLVVAGVSAGSDCLP